MFTRYLFLILFTIFNFSLAIDDLKEGIADQDKTICKKTGRSLSDAIDALKEGIVDQDKTICKKTGRSLSESDCFSNDDECKIDFSIVDGKVVVKSIYKPSKEQNLPNTLKRSVSDTKLSEIKSDECQNNPRSISYSNLANSDNDNLSNKGNYYDGDIYYCAVFDNPLYDPNFENEINK